MHKKILSGLMALAMVTPAFADVTSAGGTGSVPVELNSEATNFSVTVPTGLPVDVAADGTITVSQENYIVNNSFGPVAVKGAKIETVSGWTLKDFTSRFETLKVNAKEFGFQLNGCNVETSGNVAVTNFKPIDGGAKQKFSYDSKVAPQAEKVETQQIASVVFTLGWDDAKNVPQIPADGNIPITAEFFPDPGFRSALKNFTFGANSKANGSILIDGNQDGVLSLAEREKVWFLDCSGSQSYKITDVTGVEYFPNLCGFETDCTQLICADFSKNDGFYDQYDSSARLPAAANYAGYWDRNKSQPNAFPIPNTGTLDLNDLPGSFDPSKAHNFKGCTRQGDILTFDKSAKKQITYEYDCGRSGLNTRCSKPGYVQFKLQPTEGAVLPQF